MTPRFLNATHSSAMRSDDSALIERMPHRMTPERTPKSRSPARSPWMTASTIGASLSPRCVCSIGE